MAKRKTPNLAYCEYVSPDQGYSIEVGRARLQLIETVKRVYPTLLEKLAAEVFPHYCDLAEEGFEFDRILWSPPRVSPFEVLPEDSGLKSALSKWATEFNVEAVWLIDQALRTLRDWYVTPEWRESLTWHQMYPHEGGATGERATTVVGWVGWEKIGIGQRSGKEVEDELSGSM